MPALLRATARVAPTHFSSVNMVIFVQILYACYNNGMKYYSYKKYFVIFFIIASFGCINFVYAKTATTTEDFRGRVVLQSAHYNDVWYVHPKTLKRYYVPHRWELDTLMRTLGVGILTKDLEKIAIPWSGKSSDPAMLKRFLGYIVLQVENKGEAWYINPSDGFRYYLPSGEEGFNILRSLGIGASNNELRMIPMNATQLYATFTFTAYAHVKLDAGKYSQAYYADNILPLASLTKLMTALVILDTKPDWEKKITITREDIQYPKIYVDPDDVTSEVDFQEGDTVTYQDLFNAFLASSSNQAAGVLAKNSGITYKEFIKKMNDKAKSLGLKKTRFTDPSGLDTLNVGTAKEFAIIARTAFNIAKIKTTTIKSFTIQAKRPDDTTREIIVPNRNQSILKFGPDAAKSGFLYEAQRNVAYKEGNAIVVILHARSLTEKNTLIKKLLKP